MNGHGLKLFICMMVLSGGMSVDAARLAGTVTDTNGVPLELLPVQVLRLSTISGNLIVDSGFSTETDNAGFFQTDDLPATNYWLRINDTTKDAFGNEVPTGYEALYYHPLGNQPNRDANSPIIVETTTPDLSGLDFQLRQAYAVTGLVTAAGVLDFSSVDFDVYDANTGNFLSLLNAKATTSGSYVIYGFAYGASFHVKCDPPPSMGRYIVYQGDQFLRNAAIPVTSSSADVTIHFNLQNGYRLHGFVSNAVSALSGIDLDTYIPRNDGMYDLVPDVALKSGTPMGDFQTTLMPPGTYIIAADPLASTFFLKNHFTTNGVQAFTQEEASVLTISTTDLSGINIVLSAGGNISGHISSTNGMNLADIDLDVFDANGALVGVNASSDTNGSYTVGSLAAGNYFVRADPDPAQGYIAVYFSNGLFEADAALISVIAGQVTSNIDYSLERGGVLSGHITDTNGLDLADIDIDVFDSTGQRMKEDAASDATGNYEIGPFPAGMYTVRADPQASQGYVRLYYSNDLFYGGDTPVAMLAEQDVTNVNFVLPSGWIISGTITDTNGQSISGIDLDVFTTNGVRMEGTALTDANGQYSIGAYPAGDYQVRADPAVTQPYVGVYYTTNLFSEEAATVSILPELGTTNINFQLKTGGFLAGRLTNAAGQPAAYIDMDLYNEQNQRIEVPGQSDSNGFFIIGALPSGNYTFRADPKPARFLARTYFAGVLLSESATAVSVTAPLTNSGLDMMLGPAGAIAGTIFNASTNTPLARIDLDAFDTNGIRAEADGQSAVDGSYLFGPLPPGNYILRADPGTDDFYVREYWSGETRMTSAVQITVSAGMTVSNYNFSLQDGASISGQITDLQTNGLADIDIDVFAGSGAQGLEQTALTDTNGFYAIGPVPLGSWFVRANPSEVQGFETRYYISEGNISNALPINIVVTQHVSGINFALGTNFPPQATLGTFEGIQTGALILDGSGSTDANGDRLLFSWRQLSGPAAMISDSNAVSPMITMPGGSDDEIFVFELVTEDFSTTSPPLQIRVANGLPRLWNLGRSGGMMQVSWTLGSPAQPYALEESTNLIHWTEVMSGNALEQNVSPGTNRQFYRVSATNAP